MKWIWRGIVLSALLLAVLFVAPRLSIGALGPVTANERAGAGFERLVGGVARPAFPELSGLALIPVQARVIAAASAQYAKDPRRYDETVMGYTQGVREPWCADFVSFVMREAGVPLVNPHSGGWRIPGVYTLRDYYVKGGRYEAAGSYVPRPGDVAIFDGRQGLDPSSRQHTAIVVKVEGDTMTTVGGNERGRVRLSELPYFGGAHNLVGFGRLSDG